MIEKFNDLLGRTLSDIRVGDKKESILFTLDDGEQYQLYHYQDCCESVYVEDIVGNLEDLVGTPLTLADEAVEGGEPLSEYDESYTWTFYRLATVKGYVTIRWYGTSNGYYCERVDWVKV